MSKRTKLNLTLIILSLVFSWFAATYLNGFFSSGLRNFDYQWKLMLDKPTFVVGGIIEFLIICWMILEYRGDYDKKLRKGRDIDVGLENSHFMDEKNIKKNFDVVSFNKLEEVDSGVVVAAKQNKLTKKMTIAIAVPIHTLVIGNTGSGKTTAFISPNIQLIGRCKDKASMIIADPKGELFNNHSKFLLDQGYKIQLVDLINPLRTARWNPLSQVYDKYQKMLSMGDDNELEKQELDGEIYLLLSELVQCLFPVNPNVKETHWEQGSQNFILAVLLAMLEDSSDPKKGMTKAKYNFANVRTLCSFTKNECEALKMYFESRPLTSNVRIKANSVLESQGGTLTSYFTTIGRMLDAFSDETICSFMSENEIILETFDEVPTALFLKIPDEQKSRYNIAAAFFVNTYKDLVAKARKNENGELKRQVYFILDEFGNLPPFPDIEKMLAMARSRKITFIIVLQSYEQLEKVYGRADGNIIKDNCNIEAFIGSKEFRTCEEFAKKCGNYSRTNSSVNQPVTGDGTANTSTQSRPLIYPIDLAKLNNPPDVMGNVIFVMSGKSPLKSIFTADFKCSKYEFGKCEIEQVERKLFNANINYYDIFKQAEDGIDEMEYYNNQEVYEEIPSPPKKSESSLNKTVIRYLQQLEVANEGALKELIRHQDYTRLITLLEDGVQIAKSQHKNNIVGILSHEIVICQRQLDDLNDNENS